MSRTKLIMAFNGTDSMGEFPWRSGNQIRGVRAQLQAEINLCRNGSEITLDLTTAHSLIEICRQAAHTEDGHMS